MAEEEHWLRECDWEVTQHAQKNLLEGEGILTVSRSTEPIRPSPPPGARTRSGMGADGSNANGRGRPDRPRSSPSGDTITPEEVERRCYNWAEVELEGSTWPDISWMDYCPCEEAFYAGTYIASCERTGTAPPSGAAPAPLPSRSGSPGASSSSTDNEAGIFMLVYAAFATVSFLALIGVTWW